MTDTAFTAQDIAVFLQENPGFFDEHADVFATLQVPHPHGSRAISLGERQILALRERTRELEWRLNELGKPPLKDRPKRQRREAANASAEPRVLNPHAPDAHVAEAIVEVAIVEMRLPAAQDPIVRGAPDHEPA